MTASSSEWVQSALCSSSLIIGTFFLQRQHQRRSIALSYPSPTAPPARRGFSTSSYVNGISAGILDAMHEEAPGTYRLKVANLKPGLCQMKFVVDRGNPLPAGADPRRLGFYLRALQVLPSQLFSYYNFGTTMDFSSPNSSQFLARGWSAQEPHGRWSDGKTAEIKFRLRMPPQAPSRPSVLMIRGGKYQSAGHNTQIRLSFNGKILGSLDSQHLSGEDVYGFPVGRLEAANCTVRLLVDNPKTRSSAGDPRQLGFYIRSLKIDLN